MALTVPVSDARGHNLRRREAEREPLGDKSQLVVKEDDLGTAESQQVSAVAAHDLVASAGGHGHSEYNLERTNTKLQHIPIP